MTHNQGGDTAIDRRNWIKATALGGTALAAGTSMAAEPGASAPKRVRGVIFLVSDGMSPGVLTMAEAFSQSARKCGTRWWNLLSRPDSSHGLMDCASANSLVTDSAAAASAWGCGQRVNNGAINFSPDGKELTPIAAIAKKNKARIGLVSTATITHATPAGFAASVRSRGDEDGIAEQYLNRVDVLLGGGSGFFDPKVRKDGKDLFANFAAAGYGVVRNRKAMLDSRETKLLGTFTRGHLPYTVDRNHDEAMAAAVPTLAEMTRVALERFLPGDEPFLLQVEGARVDHAAHLNDIAGLLWDQLAFDDAVAAAMTLTADREDILIVVTSDHGNANPGLNGMGGGYSGSNQAFERIGGLEASHERLFGEWKKQGAGSAAGLTSLVSERLGISLKSEEAAALIESFSQRPIIEWNEQLSNPEGLLGQIVGNHTGIGWTGTTHTSDPTIVTALGPRSHRFSGLVKNTDVFGYLSEMLG